MGASGHRFACAAALAGLAACGGGSGAVPRSSGSNLDSGTLAVVELVPAPGAVQVDPDASIEALFDGVLAQDCLLDPDTGIFRVRDGARVSALLELDHGRRIVATPTAPLDPETDYEWRVAALTCDVDGRLLDTPLRVPFRTVDGTPPFLVGSEPRDGASGTPRAGPYRLAFDDALDAASIDTASLTLLDARGTAVPITWTVDGANLELRPRVELPGDREYRIVVRGARDRSGNRNGSSLATRFRTALDREPPRLVATWPPPGAIVSPRARVELGFDEAIELPPATEQRPDLVDDLGESFGIALQLAEDRRRLELVPLEPLPQGVLVSLRLGPDHPVADLSGNLSAHPVEFSFRIGEDQAAPRLLSSSPADAALRVDPAAALRWHFDEPLDPLWLTPDAVELDAGGRVLPLATLELGADGRSLVGTPAEPLPLDTALTCRLRAAPRAVRDPAGNALDADLVTTFVTSADATPLTLVVWPEPGAVGVPFDATIAMLADAALDPTTLDTTRVRVLDARDEPVAGTLALERGDRVIRFVPQDRWTPGAAYRICVAGGLAGLRKASGNALAADHEQVFTVGFRADTDPPELEVTVDGIAAPRNASRVLSSRHVTLDLRAQAGTDPSLDLSRAVLELTGPSDVPAPELLFSRATIGARTLRVQLTRDERLAPGRYVLHGSVRDLSGNLGVAPPLEFEIADPTTDVTPFERTQIVWVRFDMDRDGNGRGDFDDDLLRLGLASEGDPLGTNARIAAILRDAVLAAAHGLFGRRPDGSPLGPDSVPLRFVSRAPLGLTSMQIAVGGLDPEGARGRGFGDPSSGTLGRARFDHRNALVNEHAIELSPGLGVFPSELFLFEARVHLDVYPSFVTSFARRFLPLVQGMGGTPAGSHALDARVLDPGFDPDSASGAERARFESIWRAADDWAVGVATILAHEVGHAVGLVAPGVDSRGLHGDATLHDEYSEPGLVMAPAIGFDAIVALPFAFRDLDAAYLRQRVLLR